MQSKYDSSIYFYEKAIRIYKKVGNNELLGICYSNIAIDFQQKSNFPMALLYFQQALKISEESKNEIHQAYANLDIGNTYSNMGDSARAESTYLNNLNRLKKCPHILLLTLFLTLFLLLEPIKFHAYCRDK
jgi:two-component system, NtrC family, sensor kinase